MAEGRWQEIARQDKSSRRLSLLEVPPSFFDEARLLHHEDDGSSFPADGFPLSIPSEASSSQADLGSLGLLNRWTCNSCSNLEFSCLDEQRLHFKSDFHRFNVKRKLKGKDAISEEGFELLAKGQHRKESDGDDDNVSSISGSGEEDSDSSNGGEEPLHPRSSSMPKSQSYISVMLPLSGEIATVWKCLLSRDNERLVKQEGKSGIGGKDFVTEEELLQRLKKFVSRDGSEESNLWTILLLRGGHFAGCIFDCRKGSILAHKTYHRYVVRAKAGGKQSTKDGTGQAPKSAGASLRRHNEASLHREIRDLLASWKGYLEAASCIYVHAPSRNSNVVFGGEDAPLARNDRRVRNVPFTTRRPTFKEAKRTFNELITVSIHSLELTQVAGSARIPESGRHQALIQLDGDLVTTDRTKEAKGDAKPNNFPDGKKDEELISSIPASANGNAENSSPLHDAARLGQMDLVLELLEKGANPCAKDHRGQTPYNLASDKETRNVFRRFMATNMEMWDWHSANVPSPLTEEMEAAQAAKQAEKDAKRKAKTKEQKKMRKEKLKAREMAAATSLEKTIPEKSNNLDSDANQLAAFNEKRAAEATEREKRALAAERRIKALSLGSANSNTNSQGGSCCSYCGESLAGKTPFYRLSFQYCTTACVRLHREALD